MKTLNDGLDADTAVDIGEMGGLDEANTAYWIKKR